MKPLLGFVGIVLIINGFIFHPYLSIIGGVVVWKAAVKGLRL